MLWIKKQFEDGRIEYKNENEMDVICFLAEETGWSILDFEEASKLDKLKQSNIIFREITAEGKRVSEYIPPDNPWELLC